VGPKERRDVKASEGPDELSKASCVRGCWLESSKVPPLEGRSAGPEVTCWVPSFLDFFLGGSCPA
jgi:hypothetical protein